MVLRPLIASDAEALFAVFSDPQVCTYWSGPPHKTQAETHAYVALSVADSTSTCWVLTLQNDQALGWIYLGDRRSGIAEIGFILRRDHWGKGLVVEAAHAVVQYGFDQRNLRRIYADADPDNAGSIRVIEKLGFLYEGRARGNWNTHIGVRDSLIYGRLCTDPPS
ncbi:MAG: GNAT family N-acetyltransferase [Robiginitomaculum sp.]|nr:MAG: GNAT family N-acetyltransferase [Robiginitomaculum sp.]